MWVSKACSVVSKACVCVSKACRVWFRRLVGCVWVSKACRMCGVEGL